jgi:hypothetical protein
MIDLASKPMDCSRPCRTKGARASNTHGHCGAVAQSHEGQRLGVGYEHARNDEAGRPAQDKGAQDEGRTDDDHPPLIDPPIAVGVERAFGNTLLHRSAQPIAIRTCSRASAEEALPNLPPIVNFRSSGRFAIDRSDRGRHSVW